MARRTKKAEPHGNHERWLITYADLITLLLVFFIIMYAMSKVDQAKFDVIAKALMFQFKKSDTIMPQGTGAIGKSNPGQGNEGDQAKKSPADTMAELKQQDEQQEQLKEQLQAQQDKERQLQNLLQKINDYIKENNLEPQISVNDTPRGIAVTLNDLFLFDLGKADLRPAAYPILEKLSSLFPTLQALISIEGHTDDLPLSLGNPYKDNWRLSSERSLSVLRYFTEKAKLPETMFMSVAHADTQPVAPNDSNENRQKNRRVEIIVLRDNATVKQ